MRSAWSVSPRTQLRRRKVILAFLNRLSNKQLPTYYHPIAAKDLARACERAGLDVVLAREQFHPGWPSACPYDGRENAQVVARKKN